MKASMKRMAVKKAQGLAWLCLLALLALFGAGVARSTQAGAQLSGACSALNLKCQAATNGDIHITPQAASNGDVIIGNTDATTGAWIAATNGNIHIGG